MARSEIGKMRGTRPPAVAGFFYPDDADRLCRLLDELLEGAEADRNAAANNAAANNAAANGEETPKAIIAPHAGYPYSGPIAGSAFEPFRPLAGRVERVVVIGPSHHVAFRGLALPMAASFETPLGRIDVDLEAAGALLELPQVGLDDRPHEREHALEVELPFLRRVLGEFRLVPLVVGEARPEEVAEALWQVWGGEETRIVVSSDLSHFLNYDEARSKDRRTADEILGLSSSIVPTEACGAAAINGLLHLAAGTEPLTAQLLDLRNSGDTAGDRQRVVGYGAFSFARRKDSRDRRAE